MGILTLGMRPSQHEAYSIPPEIPFGNERTSRESFFGEPMEERKIVIRKTGKFMELHRQIGDILLEIIPRRESVEIGPTYTYNRTWWIR